MITTSPKRPGSPIRCRVPTQGNPHDLAIPDTSPPAARWRWLHLRDLTLFRSPDQTKLRPADHRAADHPGAPCLRWPLPRVLPRAVHVRNRSISECLTRSSRWVSVIREQQ